MNLFKKMKSNFFEKTLASGEPVFPSWCEKNQKTGPHRAMMSELREENSMTYKTLLEKTEKIQKNAELLSDETENASYLADVFMDEEDGKDYRRELFESAKRIKEYSEAIANEADLILKALQ